MVEQNAIAGIHAVGLPVVHCDPVGVELGHSVGAARVKGVVSRCLLLYQAVELGCGGLVDAGFVCKTADAYRLKDAQGAQSIHVGGVFRCLEAHRHMALGAEVVDLIGLHLLNDALQVAAVAQVAVVQLQALIQLVRILIEVIDPGGVETAGPALDAMHGVALLQQQLRQVAAVLAGDAGDQRVFAVAHGCHYPCRCVLTPSKLTADHAFLRSDRRVRCRELVSSTSLRLSIARAFTSAISFLQACGRISHGVAGSSVCL